MPRRGSRVSGRSRAAAALLVAGAAAAAAVAPWPASAVERGYSRGLYIWLQPYVTGVTNRVAASTLDVLVAVAVAWCVWLGWRIVAAGAGRRWRAMGRSAVSSVGMAGALYLAFLLLWGLNYQRRPLVGAFDHDPARVTPQTVRAFADRAVAAANALRVVLPPGTAGWPDDEALAAELSAPFRTTLASLGLPASIRPARPKVPLLAVYFRAAGVSGMTNPWGLETLLADNLLPFERPLAMAHEWGHLAGLGPEAEAGLVGFLTCMRAGAPARYSAWLDAALRSARSLPEGDRAALLRTLSPAVLDDVRAMATRSRRDEVRWVNVAAWDAYDRYLRAHRVESGVRSYDEVVVLLVGTSFDASWSPGRR